MLLQTSQGQSGSAHVVVLGNEKGGSGKSTTALHIAVALLKAGQRVATIDLDCRQQSFTRYINNRRAWASRTGLDLEIPVHRCIKLGQTMQIAENETTEFEQFEESVRTAEHCFDFIVIDTPGSDSYLMRLAHSMADTLVTPINDSFLDFDVLGTVDPETYSVTGESHYSEMVRDMRRRRRQIDGVSTDWIVVRNRLSMLGSRNKQLVADGLNELSLRLGFRSIDGFAERVVYREFFPRGLTALDDLDEETLGTARRSRACCANSNCLWTNVAAAAPPTAPSGSVRSTSRWNSMTSSVPEIVPASSCGRERGQSGFRISVELSRSGREAVYQGLVLPGFYPKSEPAFDLERPSLRALGGGGSGGNLCSGNSAPHNDRAAKCQYLVFPSQQRELY
jgi:chromosome partitioning protein